MRSTSADRFDPALLAGEPEPVRRYFLHALAPGADISGATHLRMRGRIDVGTWLNFEAEWTGDARSFRWAARAGPGRLRALRVLDQYRLDPAGEPVASMDVRAFGRLRLVRADGIDVVRSGAGRAAVEAIWAPAGLLPHRGVRWSVLDDADQLAVLMHTGVPEQRNPRLDSGDAIILADWHVAPEHPALAVHIDSSGAVKRAVVRRWDGGEHTGRGRRRGQPGYVPCGANVSAHERFGDLTLPSRLSAGWWWGTDRYRPFFEAEVLAAAARPVCTA